MPYCASTDVYGSVNFNVFSEWCSHHQDQPQTVFITCTYAQSLPAAPHAPRLRAPWILWSLAVVNTFAVCNRGLYIGMGSYDMWALRPTLAYS